MSEQKSVLHGRLTPRLVSTNVTDSMETQPLSEPVRMRVPTLSPAAPQNAPPEDAGGAPTVMASSAPPPRREVRELVSDRAHNSPGGHPPSINDTATTTHLRALFNQFGVDGVLAFGQLYALLEYVRTTFDCTPGSHIPSNPLSVTLLQTLWREAISTDLEAIISFPRFRIFFEAYVPQRFTYYKLLHPSPDAPSAMGSSDSRSSASRGGPEPPSIHVTKVPQIPPLVRAFRQCCIQNFGSVENAVENLLLPPSNTITADCLHQHMTLPKTLHVKCNGIARELQRLALKHMSPRCSRLHSNRRSMRVSEIGCGDSVLLGRMDFVPLLEYWHTDAQGSTVPLATRVASARVCLKKIRDERLAYENSVTFAQNAFGKRHTPPHRLTPSAAFNVRQLKVDLAALEKRAHLTFARYAPLIGDDNLAELRSVANASRGMGDRSPVRVKTAAFTEDQGRDVDLPIWFLKADDMFEEPADLLHSDKKMITLRSTWTKKHQLQHFQLRFLPLVSARLDVSPTKFLGKVSNETEHKFFSTLVDLSMDSLSSFINALLAFLPDTFGRMRIPTRVGTVVKRKELLIVEHFANDFTSERCIELRMGTVPATDSIEDCTSVKMVNLVNPPEQLLQRLESRWKNQQRMKKMSGGEDKNNVSKVRFVESCVGTMSVREIVDVALDLPYREKVIKAVAESLFQQTTTLCSILLDNTEPQMWINSGLFIYVDVIEQSTSPILKLGEFGQSTLHFEQKNASDALNARPKEDKEGDSGKKKLVWDSYVHSVIRLHFELCCFYCNRFCVEEIAQARVRIITMSGKVKAIGPGSLVDEDGMMELRTKDASSPIGLLSYTYAYGPRWKFTMLKWSNPADNEMVRVEVTCHESQDPDATDQRITTKTTSFGKGTFANPVVEWFLGGDVKMDDLSEQHQTPLSFPPSHRASRDVMHHAFQKYLHRVKRIAKKQKGDRTSRSAARRSGFRFAQAAASGRQRPTLGAAGMGLRRMDSESTARNPVQFTMRSEEDSDDTRDGDTHISRLTTTSRGTATTLKRILGHWGAQPGHGVSIGTKNDSDDSDSDSDSEEREERGIDAKTTDGASRGIAGEKRVVISGDLSDNHAVDTATSTLSRTTKLDDDTILSVTPLTTMGEGHFLEVALKNDASRTYVGKVTTPESLEAIFFRKIKALDLEGDDTFTALNAFLPRTLGVKKADGHAALEGKELIVMENFNAETDTARFAHINIGETHGTRSTGGAPPMDESTTTVTVRQGYRLERMDNEPSVLDQLATYAGQAQLTLMPPALRRAQYYSNLSAMELLTHLFDMRSTRQSGEREVLQVVQMALKEMLPLVAAVRSLSVPQAWTMSSLGISVSMGAAPAINVKLFDFGQSTLVFPSEWRELEKNADKMMEHTQLWAHYTRGICRLYYELCRFYNQRLCCPQWDTIVARVMDSGGKVKGTCRISLPLVETIFDVDVMSTRPSTPVGSLHVKAYSGDDVVRLSFTKLSWKGALKDPLCVAVSVYENAGDVDSGVKHIGRVFTQSTSFGVENFETDTVEWLTRKNAEPMEALTELPLDNKHFPSTDVDEAFDVFMEAL
eukprot:GEMP01000790.1.p1 GENE.GEMP01000790.1~~GEMP01000790.1.p1  ORF type:complete len:1574 (+),score=455.14 GEMP01000790.1:335-5056(+)